MSYWTYIDGYIAVRPMGRTQAEKRYVLDTVLEHLPYVTGSERNMVVHVVQAAGYSCSSSHNEFEEPMCYRHGASDTWMRAQEKYLLLLEGHLRDRMYEDTLREFSKWLNRLAKRVHVSDILARVSGQDKVHIFDEADPYGEMEEWPSWCEKESGGEPAWAEYLLYDTCKRSPYPLKLAYKYYDDPDVETEVRRRLAYEND